METIKPATARLVIAALIFLSIAVASIVFIFSPVKNITEYQGIEGNTITEESAFSALNFEGGALLSRSWHKYPDYTIGLGVAGGLSFAGFIYCIAMAEKARREATIL